MTALLYVRVSTEEQARRGFSIPEQLEACRRRSAELGAVDLIEIIDDVGGDLLERPKLEQARQLVRSGRIKWFICFDPDRFSRDLLNQLLVTSEIDKAGVELVFIQHNRQKTPEGEMFYAIRGAISQFEKKKIIERTQRGKRGKAKKGLLPGYLDPYGYEMDTEADRLVINETEAEWVRSIFAWASAPDPAERLGQWRIAERLNQMGVPAPRSEHWYRSTVAGILRNRLYTGRLRWGRYDHTGVYQSRRGGGERRRPRPRPEAEVIELPVPPIISAETFERVQTYLALDRRRQGRRVAYMLTGLGRCGLCGGPIQSKRMRLRYLVCANRYPAYRTMGPARRTATQPCRLPHIRAERVEEHLWRRVSAWLTEPSLLGAVLAADGPAASPRRPLEADLGAVVRQIEQLEQAQGRVLALVARTQLKPELAEAQVSRLQGRIDALNRRRAELEAELARLEEDAAIAGPGAAAAAGPAAMAGPQAESLAVGAEASPAAGAEALAEEVRRRLAALSDANRNNLVRRLVAQVVIRGKQEEEWEVIPLGSARGVSAPAWGGSG